MKALMVTRQSARNGGFNNDLATCVSSLDALGIKYRRAVVEAMPSDSQVNSDYDFIVIPSMQAGFLGVIDNANITIPILTLDGGAGLAGYGATPGINVNAGGPIDQFADVSWSTRKFMNFNAFWYGSDGAATTIEYIVSSAVDAISGTPQSKPGTVCMWSTPCCNGNTRLFSSTIQAHLNFALPFLIQAAIDEGYIDSGRIPRKAPFNIDLDHINGVYVDADPTVLDTIASLIPAGGMMWGGMQNSNITTYITNMKEEVKQKLLQYHAEGKYKFCYHEHGNGGADQPCTGSWPYVSGGGTLVDAHTKIEQDTIYQASADAWEAKGLPLDFPAFYNAGANNWNDETIALFSQRISISSDPLTQESKAGYGFVGFRARRNCSRGNETEGTLFFNQHKRKRKVNGIQQFSVTDLANNTTPLPFTSVHWRNHIRYFMQGISCGMALYLHEEDFQAGEQLEDGGIQHGVEMMNIIGDTGRFLKNVCIPFADPIDYVV